MMMNIKVGGDMVSLIGITGPARHGKDTVGEMLHEMLPATSMFSFAEHIKTFLESLMETSQGPDKNKEGLQVFAFDIGDVAVDMLNTLHRGILKYDYIDHAYSAFFEVLKENHEDYEEFNRTATFTSSWRKLYQLIGTQWGRQRVNEMFWIEPYLPSKDAIVTDVRGHGDSEFYHDIEAKAIKDYGGIIVKVYDPRKSNPQVRKHESEAGIHDEYIDYTIVNDGSIEDLRAKVKAIVKQL